MENDFLKDLNPQQQKAVKDTIGAQIILAGAGSGKTRVLTYKVIYLLKAKNQLINFSDYRNYARGFFQETVADIYPVYQKILKENNALDFDDLILETVSLFNNSPEVLEKYQNKFKYILIDEYQDTNH